MDKENVSIEQEEDKSKADDLSQSSEESLKGQKPDDKRADGGDESGERDDSGKEAIKIEHIKPGTIMKGKLFSEDNKLLFEEYHVFNENDLNQLNEKGIKEVYFIPAIDTISNDTKKQSLQFMEQFLQIIKSGKAANISDSKQVINLMISDVYDKEVGLITLLELKDYSDYAYVHSVNVGILTMIFAKKLGLSSTDARSIGLGSFLHDVGKINTPDEMIWKVVGDNDYEKTTIQEHPMFGYRILESTGEVPDDVLDIVIGHHEHADGSGYPAGLKSKSLDKFVNIVAICNYYDYLIEKVDGKESLSPREAVLNIYELSGKFFNPFFVKPFVNELSYLLLNNPLYPIESLILLNTREIAIVDEIARYSDMKPVVRIISNHKGQKLKRFIPVN